MKLQKKFIVIGLILLVAILGFFLFPREQKEALQFYTVQRQDIKNTVSAAGTLTGVNSFDLKFRSSGRITSLNVKTADLVTSNQILASLDNIVQIIALNQAQNTLRDKQALVDKVLDDIHLFQYGMGGFDNVGSSNETMQQRSIRTQAEVVRDNAQDSVKLAQKNLEDTLIMAPVAGVITGVNATLNQQVGTSDVILKMTGTDEIFFEAEVDEADLSRVLLNQKAEVILDAYPNQKFDGLVDQIQPQTKITSSGASVIPIRIKLVDFKITFVNGLSGQVSIIVSQAQNAITIPQEALREDDTIFVQEDTSIRSKKVTPGIKSDTDVEIKEGLKEGEKVLLNPPSSGAGINRNRNSLQGIIFRIFRGGRNR